MCGWSAFLRVDIGTEWNLESFDISAKSGTEGVDIGTEWNLEVSIANSLYTVSIVDIGTEWNLEMVYVSKGFMRSE